MKKRFSFIFIVFSVLLTVFSCKGKTEDVQKDMIVMAIPVDPDGLDPHATASASTFQITNNIYETLITVDHDGNLVPSLADSWEISDDGLSIRFHIRKDAFFSDGRACDASAVIASFERLKSDKGIRSNDYAFISSMEADGEYAVFHMDSLDVAALSSFAYAWAAVVDASSDDLKSSPVGTGPYKLASWVPQQALVLERNEYYRKDDVRNDGVRFVIMPDLTAEITALERGEVDIILITGDLASAVEGKGFRILAEAGNGLQLMAMNQSNEALSDIRVRQAINYAVDKDELIDAVWWGYGKKIGSHFPVVLKEYIDLSDTYGYDPDKARALLAEAGYGDGLELRMYLPKNYQEYVNAGLVIAASLEKVGIKVDVNIVEWAYWLSEVYSGRNYDLTVVGHTGRLDPYALLVKYQSGGKENYFNYSNPDVDMLLEEYRTELDEDKRTGYIQEIERILANDVPALYIQDPIQIYVTKPQIEGFTTYPINIYQMKDVYRLK